MLATLKMMLPSACRRWKMPYLPCCSDSASSASCSFAPSIFCGADREPQRQDLASLDAPRLRSFAGRQASARRDSRRRGGCRPHDGISSSRSTIARTSGSTTARRQRSSCRGIGSGSVRFERAVGSRPRARSASSADVALRMLAGTATRAIRASCELQRLGPRVIATSAATARLPRRPHR